MAVTVIFNPGISLALCGTPQAGLCQTGSEAVGLVWARLCHAVSAGKHSGHQLLSLGMGPISLVIMWVHYISFIQPVHLGNWWSSQISFWRFLKGRWRKKKMFVVRWMSSETTGMAVVGLGQLCPGDLCSSSGSLWVLSCLQCSQSCFLGSLAECLEIPVKFCKSCFSAPTRFAVERKWTHFS